jgi:hypothetical protein
MRPRFSLFMDPRYGNYFHCRPLLPRRSPRLRSKGTPPWFRLNSYMPSYHTKFQPLKCCRSREKCVLKCRPKNTDKSPASVGQHVTHCACHKQFCCHRFDLFRTIRHSRLYMHRVGPTALCTRAGFMPRLH